MGEGRSWNLWGCCARLCYPSFPCGGLAQQQLRGLTRERQPEVGWLRFASKQASGGEETFLLRRGSSAAPAPKSSGREGGMSSQAGPGFPGRERASVPQAEGAGGQAASKQASWGSSSTVAMWVQRRKHRWQMPGEERAQAPSAETRREPWRAVQMQQEQAAARVQKRRGCDVGETRAAGCAERCARKSLREELVPCILCSPRPRVLEVVLLVRKFIS